MIFLFDRKEPLTTFSMQEQARARDLLAANGVDYSIRTLDSSARDGRRGRSVPPGAPLATSRSYTIYVRARDYERAKELLRSGRA